GRGGFSGTFQQPLISDPGIPAELALTALNVVGGSVVPTIAAKSSSMGLPINIQYQGIYNNLGIPGAGVHDLVAVTGDATQLQADAVKYAMGQISTAQLFADIVLRFPVLPGTTTPATALAQAIGAQGTFYTVEVGGDDVIDAVETGVVLDGVTMTTTANFQADYTTLLGAIRQQRPSAGIVVMNLTDETLWPFCTTIKPYVVGSTGAHIPLLGENGPLTEQDLVTLPASALIAQGYGIPGTGRLLPEGSIDQAGLHAGVIIRAAERAAIRARIGELNQVISTVANGVGAKVWDINTLWDQVVAGTYVLGGVPVSSAFLTGGMIGYDGIHPTDLGYAVMANDLVKTVNAQFGSKLPLVNLLPFLTGGATAGATSVAAANVVMSQEAAVAIVKSSVPGVLTDKLETGHTVHRRLTARTDHGVIDPPNP
ncbi:MAG TPA: SGNH/GDSL hydrolase family protein, partial [Thermoanaerobaculaceae bacterium]|nr:SGNH/GDSL hydrolase family protein [Thermoanaerobaculaceae bacterium]